MSNYYVDSRGTEFYIHDKGNTGFVPHGNWGFKIIENNIKTTGELKVEHPDSEHRPDKMMMFTFKNVKELNNDLLRSSGK